VAQAPAAFASAGNSGGFAVPEAARYDADLDAFFVTNIDGNPSQKDGKARIMKVAAGDSAAAPTVLVEGGRNGVTLNAPKGMAIVGDTLWVADIDVVRAFDKRSGRAIRTVTPRPASTFLNDVAVGGDGAIYVTDTGIRFDASGGMSADFPNRIYRVQGDSARVALESASLGGPNGIAWDRARSRFLLAPFNGKDLLAWTPGDSALAKVATGPGGYDGLEILGDGRVLVSSWTDSTVHLVGTDGAMHPVVKGVAAPADIGVDTRRNVLAVPRFNDGRVEYFRIRDCGASGERRAARGDASRCHPDSEEPRSVTRAEGDLLHRSSALGPRPWNGGSSAFARCARSGSG
jgi:sugar lactone lactonase YvrE